MPTNRSALSLIFILAIALALPQPSAHAWPWGNKYEWVLKRDQDGVQIHVRKIKGSDFLQFNGRVTLDVPISELLRLYEERDDGRMPEWFYGCKSVRVVDTKSPDEKIFYMVFSMPRPLKDRDIVFRRIRSVDQATGVVEYHIHAFNESLPEERHKVRMPSIEVYWRLTPTPEGKTEIYYEQHSDVGGLLPAWMVNAMALEVPFKTLIGLRKLLATPEKRGVTASNTHSNAS